MKKCISEIWSKCVVYHRVELLRLFLKFFQISCILLFQLSIQLILGLDMLCQCKIASLLFLRYNTSE